MDIKMHNPYKCIDSSKIIMYTQITQMTSYFLKIKSYDAKLQYYLLQKQK